MKPIIFILSSLSDTHYRNRINEFINKNYNVEVYGFNRKNAKLPDGMEYDYHLISEVNDRPYRSRVIKYIKAFRSIGRSYDRRNVIYYLGGLDVAMFFLLVNSGAKYIFEECDLVHTYMGWIKHLFEWIDKRIIKKSLIWITTSEGFIEYHFKGVPPENMCLVENKLSPQIKDFPLIEKKVFDKKHLSFAYVGSPRFDSVYNFIDVYCKNFPQHTFHIFGGPISDKFKTLKKYSNCTFHGFFKNPQDLPEIYSQIDILLSTYDTVYENVRYAEPNKIYESIYFETPIIVSSNTFLASKVNRLGIGYEVDAMENNQIVNFINSLDEKDVEKKRKAAKVLDKREMLNINEKLYKKLNEVVYEVYFDCPSNL